MKYSQYFDRRKNTFERSYSMILENINEDKPYTIVELGTSRSFVSGGIAGCMNPDPSYWYPESPERWDWGAGIFTKVFSENLADKNIKLYTIDPSPQAIRIVTTMCSTDKVNIIKDYSTPVLKSFESKIDFLYMDHMESGEDACIKHLEDSKLIIERDLMSENGIILIDDVGDNITQTKGKYSIPYLLENGFSMVLHEYQVLLVKTPKVDKENL